MGDQNQVTYLNRVAPDARGPVVEVGSREYGSTSSFREKFAGQEYVGIDMLAGANVDQVVDLTEGIGGLKPKHFRLAICCSVLEHVRVPWVFADNLSSLVKRDGLLFLSVPWVWRYHPYPDDYFRFSWRGVMELFPQFYWSEMCYSTNLDGEFFPISDEDAGVDNRLAKPLATALGTRKYLPYLMLNMLGRKTE